MPFLHEVAVIGGGRWARVYTETLCKLFPPVQRISLHSTHCVDSLEAWLNAKGLGDRVDVSTELPRFEQPTSSAVIVTNAARDHEATARFALCSGASVLVEKPLALSFAGARELVNTASERNVRLAAANVFLFAGYIDSFARRFADKCERIRAIQVRWVDPTLESRYGETKRFDAGLPVFADVLPHITAILGVLFPKAPQRSQQLRLLRGGAQIELHLSLDGIPCTVSMARNGSRRERTIEVKLETTTVRLDFTEEPGTIVDGGVTAHADPGWDTRDRPLELMLHAFLEWVANGNMDARLSVKPALVACALIDQVSNLYHGQLVSWLIARLGIPGEDEQLRYALNEILQSDGPLDPGVLERERDKIQRVYAKTANHDWISTLVSSINRHTVLDTLDKSLCQSRSLQA